MVHCSFWNHTVQYIQTLVQDNFIFFPPSFSFFTHKGSMHSDGGTRMVFSLVSHYFVKLLLLTILARRKTEQLLNSALCLPRNNKHQPLYAAYCLKVSFQIRFSSMNEKKKNVGKNLPLKVKCRYQLCMKLLTRKETNKCLGSAG